MANKKQTEPKLLTQEEVDKLSAQLEAEQANVEVDELRDVKQLYISGNPDLPPLLLLHGTGGDEVEMLEVARYLAPENPVLSIRGRISESGYNRYFERYEVGDFNLDSLHTETAWLLETVNKLADRYRLKKDKMIAIGFSNGANVAIHSVLANEETPFKNVIAFHAMQLENIDAPQNLQGANIFLSYGKVDPIVSKESFDAMENNLRQAGADVSTFKMKASHSLSNEELKAAQAWLEANKLLGTSSSHAGYGHSHDGHDHDHGHDHHH